MMRPALVCQLMYWVSHQFAANHVPTAAKPEIASVQVSSSQTLSTIHTSDRQNTKAAGKSATTHLTAVIMTLLSSLTRAGAEMFGVQSRQREANTIPRNFDAWTHFSQSEELRSDTPKS